MGDVQVEVLKHVNLEIPAGEMLVIVGPSGSGKTTLLNLIGGLDQPSVGRIWVEDLELNRLSRSQLTKFRRRAIGFVFQFYNLIPSLTARENVLVASELTDEPLDAEEMLRLVGLESRMDHFPSKLSGGEQQRVAIARALAKNPPLLLCDEPTGALDFVTGIKVLDLLHRVNRELGKTVVLITHNAAISAMADRTLRMRSGEIVETVWHEHPVRPTEITW